MIPIPSSCWPRLIPLTVSASGSRSPARRRCSITSGTPPARNTCTVGWCRGPFGSASTRRGTRRLMAVQSLASGRRNPAACATAGRWRIRFVEPPKAACVTIALCSARVGQDVPHPYAACFQRHQRASGTASHVEPDRMAGGRERRVPERHPQRFADDLRGRGGAEELAAATRRRARAAAEIGGLLERDLAVHEAHADRLDARRHPLPASGNSVTPPGTRTQGSSCADASAIIMAGRPLSQVATPSTPRRVGSERIRRRKIDRGVVAIGQAVEHRRRSLRTPVARIGARSGKGNRAGALELAGGRLHQQPDFPVAGVVAEGDGRSVRRADAAVRARASGTRGRRAPRAPTPCPHSASTRTGRRKGAPRNISSVRGNDPAGPGALVATSSRVGSSESN